MLRQSRSRPLTPSRHSTGSMAAPAPAPGQETPATRRQSAGGAETPAARRQSSSSAHSLTRNQSCQRTFKKFHSD